MSCHLPARKLVLPLLPEVTFPFFSGNSVELHLGLRHGAVSFPVLPATLYPPGGHDSGVLRFCSLPGLMLLYTIGHGYPSADSLPD